MLPTSAALVTKLSEKYLQYNDFRAASSRNDENFNKEKRRLQLLMLKSRVLINRSFTFSDTLQPLNASVFELFALDYYSNLTVVNCVFDFGQMKRTPQIYLTNTNVQNLELINSMIKFNVLPKKFIHLPSNHIQEENTLFLLGNEVYVLVYANDKPALYPYTYFEQIFGNAFD